MRRPRATRPRRVISTTIPAVARLAPIFLTPTRPVPPPSGTTAITTAASTPRICAEYDYADQVIPSTFDSYGSNGSDGTVVSDGESVIPGIAGWTDNDDNGAMAYVYGNGGLKASATPRRVERQRLGRPGPRPDDASRRSEHRRCPDRHAPSHPCLFAAGRAVHRSHDRQLQHFDHVHRRILRSLQWDRRRQRERTLDLGRRPVRLGNHPKQL